MSWTDERVELLKKLWADGLSASQIAAELGGITRNAVIGKVHRLGLSGRAKSHLSAAPRPRKPRAPSHMLRIARASIRGNTALAHAYEIEAEAEPELIENVIPIGQRRTHPRTDRGDLPLADRRSRQRRLLLLRRQDASASLPYCAYHSRVAYQPAPTAAASAARRGSASPAASAAQFPRDDALTLQLALPKRSSSE